MSYTIEKNTNDIVIKGWENGIADDPYAGISDIRNINLISIPKEASVNFSTTQSSVSAIGTGSIVSADAGADTITVTGITGFVTLNAVYFTGGALPAGLSANTVYWLVFVSAGVYSVYSDYSLSTLVNITGTGTGTITVYNMGQPKYFTTDVNNAQYMIDANGLVWSTAQNGGAWRFTGNTGGTGKNGSGLVYYQTLANVGFLFAFSTSQIDYIKILANGAFSGGWVYGWKPSDGTTGNSGYLNNTSSTASHEAMVAPDNKVYYCDSNFIGRWYQASPTTAFVPTTTSTYIFDQTQVLPFTDVANCIAPLGNNLLIGGSKNVIYPWDTFSSLPAYPILVAENNIQKMVTVNTNTYALVGNRGRIYYTNGSQAVLFKKIPDHISGTVEPYFTWGGLTSQKNQIYFSASVTTNAGAANNNYGGLWAIDVDTKALRLANKLSYGTYAGYATAIIPNFSSNPAGTGLYIGWDSGASTYGVDITQSAPYTGGEASIETDIIPIGTFDSPKEFTRVEYKLSRPMVSGESVVVKTRLIFNTVATGYSTTLSDSTVGNFSLSAPVNFKNAQWIQLEAVLTSTSSSPSYVRLTELRIS